MHCKWTSGAVLVPQGSRKGRDPRWEHPWWSGWISPGMVSPAWRAPGAPQKSATSRLTFWRCLHLVLIPVTWCLQRSRNVSVTNPGTTVGVLFAVLKSWLQCVKAGFWKGYCLSCYMWKSCNYISESLLRCLVLCVSLWESRIIHSLLFKKKKVILAPQSTFVF